MTRLLTLGWVVRAHGVRGLIRARLDIEDMSWLQPGLELLVGDTPRELLRFGPAPGGAPHYLVGLHGVDGRDAAAALKGQTVQVARAALPELGDDEGFYAGDLIGFEAETLGGDALGEILDVFTLADRLMARVAHGLIPLDGPVLDAVDFEAQRVVFDLPEGLFEAQE